MTATIESVKAFDSADSPNKQSQKRILVGEDIYFIVSKTEPLTLNSAVLVEVYRNTVHTPFVRKITMTLEELKELRKRSQN